MWALQDNEIVLENKVTIYARILWKYFVTKNVMFKTFEDNIDLFLYVYIIYIMYDQSTIQARVTTFRYLDEMS